jgi:hypothetical protein
MSDSPSNETFKTGTEATSIIIPDAMSKKVKIGEYGEPTIEEIQRLQAVLKAYRTQKLVRKRPIRSFREFLLRETEKRVQTVLDSHRVSGGRRMDYLDFIRVCMRDIYLNVILPNPPKKEVIIRSIIDHRTDIFFTRYDVEESVFLDVLNVIYKVLSDVNKLKWEFVDYCEKQGVEVERVQPKTET